MEGIDSRAIRYKFSRVKSYIYAKCRERGCSASLKFKLKGEIYVLSSSQTRHTHHPYPSKTHMFKAIEEYLIAIPKGANLLSLKHTVCQSFRISHKQFYYILSRINRDIPTFEEYIAQIEKEGFEVYVSR